MKATIPLFILIGLSLTACDDYLDEKPLTTITTDRFYKSDGDLNQASNALYSKIAFQWRFNMHIYTEVRADDITVGPEAEDAGWLLPFDNYTYNAQDGGLNDAWGELYKCIDNANVLIEKAPAATAASAEVRQRVINEAYFFRAYAHYLLVRLWGPVPLKIQSTNGLQNLTPAKNTVDEVYAQIIADLKVAAGESSGNAGLPLSYTDANNGRATLGAAQTMLAEVFLTRKQWPEAALYAKKVIDSGRYTLWPTYNEVFLFENKYKPNGESIFEAQFHQDVDPGSRIIKWTWPRGVLISEVNGAKSPGVNDGFFSGAGNYVTSAEVYNSFDKQDARRQYLFPTSFVSKRDGKTETFNQQAPYSPIKYTLAGQPTAVWGWSANNWPILRYADALLIYAEAVNEQRSAAGDAYTAINQVRRRAGLPALAGLSQTAFREAVYDERRHEFFLEGRRFFDLVRTDRFVSALSKAGIRVTEGQKYFPIPQSEQDLNPNLK